jgi:hypothetical protein
MTRISLNSSYKKIEGIESMAENPPSEVNNNGGYMETLKKIGAGAILMLASQGVEHLAEKFGATNVKVDTMNISPAQAAIIRNDLSYDTETLTPRKKGAK